MTYIAKIKRTAVGLAVLFHRVDKLYLIFLYATELVLSGYFIFWFVQDVRRFLYALAKSS